MKSYWTLALTVLLATFAFSSNIPASAIATYVPTVTPGQWATYKVIDESCQTSAPENVCRVSILEGAELDVVAVSGTSVALRLVTDYKDGTSSQMGVSVDVATGASNVTSPFQGLTADYFLLAGSLQQNERIWNTDTAPSINLTLPETVLGTNRNINFLNTTSSSSTAGITISTRQGVASDQLSGVFTEFVYSVNSTYSNPYGGAVSTEASFAMGMVDNNIWLPNFAISSSGRMNFRTGSSGQTMIILTAQNGFSSTINLEVISPLGLSCSLSKNGLLGYGNSTLTCTGQPGSYMVTVKATSGSTTRSTPVAVEVSSAPALNQPLNSLSMLLTYAGIGIVAIIAVLVAYFLLRRKPAPPAIAPSETVPPATPA